MRKVNMVRAMSFVVLLIVTTLAGCKKDEGVDLQEQRIDELSATWQVNNVINDATDVTDQFTGFTLTIEALTFTTQNGGNAWPSSGNYSFASGTVDKIIRNDGVEVAIDEITDTSLVLSFQVSSLPGGRAAGITGNFTFSLTK